jgi:hypothetical protein
MPTILRKSYVLDHMFVKKNITVPAASPVKVKLLTIFGSASKGAC